MFSREEFEKKYPVLNPSFPTIFYHDIYNQNFYVNVSSFDNSININIPCSRTDIFLKLKEKLYQEYPELRYKNISFMHHSSYINQSLTIGENNINNGDKILIIDNNKIFW